MLGANRSQDSSGGNATAGKNVSESHAPAGRKTKKDITFTVQQSDAVQAYTQASPKGDETWIELQRTVGHKTGTG